MSSKRQPVDKRIKKLLKLDSNATCADCDSKFIKAADITYAVFLCRECGDGHIKKCPDAKIVMTNGKWTDAMVALMKSVGGNAVINRKHYESNIHNYDGRKRPGCSTRFIYDKYKWRFFCDPSDKKWYPKAGSSSTADSDSDSSDVTSKKKKKDKKDKKNKKKSKRPTRIEAPVSNEADDWDAFGGDDFVSAPAPVQPVSVPQQQRSVSAPASTQWGGNPTPAPAPSSGGMVDPFLASMIAPTKQVEKDFSAMNLFDPTYNNTGNAQQANTTNNSGNDIMSLFGPGPSANTNTSNQSGMMNTNSMGMNNNSMGMGNNSMGLGMGLGSSRNKPMKPMMGGSMGMMNMGMRGPQMRSPQNRNMGMGMGMGMNNMQNRMGGMNRGMGMNMGMGMNRGMQQRQNDPFAGMGM